MKAVFGSITCLLPPTDGASTLMEKRRCESRQYQERRSMSFRLVYTKRGSWIEASSPHVFDFLQELLVLNLHLTTERSLIRQSLGASTLCMHEKKLLRRTAAVSISKHTPCESASSNNCTKKKEGMACSFCVERLRRGTAATRKRGNVVPVA